jgi:hypothetical protein
VKRNAKCSPIESNVLPSWKQVARGIKDAISPVFIRRRQTTSVSGGTILRNEEPLKSRREKTASGELRDVLRTVHETYENGNHNGCIMTKIKEYKGTRKQEKRNKNKRMRTQLHHLFILLIKQSEIKRTISIIRMSF